MALGEVVAHRVERLGDADARDDVFALRVGEEVAVGHVLAGRRVAGERDTGAGVVALVAEHHRLHVDRGAEVVGDLLHPAVVARAAAVPGLEHGLDRVAELLLRVAREVDARLPSCTMPLNVSTSPARSSALELGVDREALLLDEVVSASSKSSPGTSSTILPNICTNRR